MNEPGAPGVSISRTSKAVEGIDMEVPLDPEIEAVVRQKVASGEYPSVAVLVEEALFLLVQRDWAERQADLNRGTPLEPRRGPQPEGGEPA